MNRFVMQLKYKDRTTFLRVYNDNQGFPTETETSAALKRLMQDKMPMIAFATFIVVAHLANTRTTVEQRMLQSMDGRRHRRRNTPKHHLHDRTIVVIDALVKEEFSLHSP